MDSRPHFRHDIRVCLVRPVTSVFTNVPWTKIVSLPFPHSLKFSFGGAWFKYQHSKIIDLNERLYGVLRHRDNLPVSLLYVCGNVSTVLCLEENVYFHSDYFAH